MSVYVGSTTGLPMVPKLSDSNVKITDWAPVQGLPSGIGFDAATGEFTANPYPSASSTGIHTVNVVPRPTDSEVKLESPTFPVTIKVGYSGEIGFDSRAFKERLGKDFTRKLTYSRAVEPVKMTAAELADGVLFNGQTFSFSGRFDSLGSHFGGTIKIEENDDPAFNRERISHFRFEMVEDIDLKVPSTMTFGQYDFRAVGITEILNVIGDEDATTPDVTYKAAEGYADLPEGLSVNAITGAVEGTPEDVGTFGPFAITAFDAYGDRKNSNEFFVTIGERKQLEVSYPGGFDHFRRYGQHSSAPVPVNGYGPFAWSIDRAPPAGIEFDKQTGTFTASSDQLIAPQEFTVTVVDTKGGSKGTATTKVTVGISERPALGLDYGNPILAFTRHIVDAGSEPAVENRVSRGGGLEFSITPVSGAELASCIAFDEATGRLSTDPACTVPIAAQDYLVTVTDRTWRDYGNANGKAEYVLGISVQERPAITLEYPDYDTAGASFGFKRHHAVTVYPEWDDPITADVSWSINPTPPTGITFNQDGSITADTGNLIPTATYVVTVSDDFDGESHLSLNLGVAERDPLAFSIDPAVTQQIELNSAYELTLDVNNVIADGDDTTQDVFYSLVSGTLPNGIFFDADGLGECGIAGTFCGEAKVSDHGKTFTVRIKATDAFNGVVEADFTFTVVEDATPMKVTYGTPSKARVGYSYKVAAPTVQFAVGNYAFSAPSLAQYGLAIDTKTGEIKGTPNSTFDRTFDITVTDKLGASRAVIATVKIASVPNPTVTVPNPVAILFNRDIPEVQQPQSSNYEAPTAWTLDPVTPPPGLTLDTATGKFVGKPSDIGKFGPYTLTLKDALPGTYPTVFGFDIAMNDDPIELEELSVVTKVGFPFETKTPEYDNALGTARFSSPELAALGLTIDPVSGVVSGSVNTVFDGRPNLVIRDRTIRTTSMPVNLTVLPKLRLTAPETISLTAFETVTPKPFVTPAFVAGAITWDDVDPSLLPVGVIYDNDGTKGCGAAATFCGTPLKAQTMDPITVTATDTFGGGQTDRAQSNPINIIVRKGVFSMEFLPDGMPGVLEEGTKRTNYSVNLVENGMFTFDGMDLSAITFGMEANADNGEALPPGLAVQKHGILSGIPLDEGTYTFDITAKYSDKPMVRGKFTVTTKRPEVNFDLQSHTFESVEKLSDFAFNFKSILQHENVPVESIRWVGPTALPNGQVPETSYGLPDMTLSQDGVLTGKPSGLGKFRFSITAAYTHRQEAYTDTVVYDLEVIGRSYKFKQIETSENYNTGYTCGINMDDEVMCWGSNQNRVLGTMDVALDAATAEPQKVFLTEKAKSLESGYDMVCAITVSDRVACWGRGYFGGSLQEARQSPVYVASNVKQVSVGNYFACAVTNTSNTICWGQNNYYQLGVANSLNTPNTVSTLNGITAHVSAGDNYACALTTVGNVKCWGQTSKFVSGASTSAKNALPTDFYTKADAVSVVAGTSGSCVLTSAGKLGSCALAPTGIATATIREIDVPIRTQANRNDSYCMRVSDDTITCSKNPVNNLTTQGSVVFPGLITHWSVGTSHICAVVQGGDTYCAGNNNYGELGVPLSSRSSATPLKVIGN